MCWVGWVWETSMHTWRRGGEEIYECVYIDGGRFVNDVCTPGLYNTTSKSLNSSHMKKKLIVSELQNMC